jgi:hypothetical protein
VCVPYYVHLHTQSGSHRERYKEYQREFRARIPERDRRNRVAGLQATSFWRSGASRDDLAHMQTVMDDYV